jgi:glycosyltransferase involved in cell wall biosynthesis
LFYWIYFFRKLANYSPNKPTKQNIPPFSILICVKNDLSNVIENIDTWVSQNSNQKEILIIDDFSGINLKQFIEKMKLEKGSLSYYKVKTNLPGKKQAIKEGLSFSRYNWSLLTDADCKPIGNNWAQLMLSTALDNNKSVVLGYSPYKVPSKSLLFLWIHFEAWLTGLLYLSFSLRGLPYMGVGRNLLYDKAIVSNEALIKNTDLISGDDDLLISQISNATNTTICIDPESFCYTSPKTSWSSYFNQKLRHYSTASRYKFKHQLLLSTFSISQFVFYLFFFLCIFNDVWEISLTCYLVRLLIIMPIVLKNIDKLKAKFSIFHFLFLDFFLSLYYLFFSLSFLWPKSKKWQ